MVFIVPQVMTGIVWLWNVKWQSETLRQCEANNWKYLFQI
jgi:hypothetical protein